MLEKTNLIIISLLGRMAFPEEKLKGIICRKKQDPAAYLEGYNACDGKHTVTEIAKIVGVTQGTITPIFQSWEKIGIIYKIESKNGKNYKNLYSIQEDSTLKRKKKTESSEKNIQTETEIKSEGEETW